MGKNWKNIRAALASVGYTSIASAADITITSMDADGTLYYTDENGNAVSILYPSATPIVVNSDTTTITVTVPSIYLAGVSGYTTTAYVNNQDGLLVTPESTFSTGNRFIFSTGGTYGQTLTAVGTGSTLLTVVHNDGATISGTTTITVGQVNTSIEASGGTLDPTGTRVVALSADTTYLLSTGLTFKNQIPEAVTTTSALLWRKWVYVSGAIKTAYYDTLSAEAQASAAVGAVLTADSTISFAYTGVTNMIVWDYNAKAYNSTYTGVTYTVTLV